MSDLPKYLPLSQRPRRDESGVSSDWSERVSAVLTSLAALVDDLTPDAQAGVHDDLARLVWLLRAGRRERFVARVRKLRPLAGDTDLVGALRGLAALPRRRPIGDLAAAVVTALDVADTAQTTVDVDPVTLGAVAVARALSAPLPIRTVLSGVTLVAADADWAVGRGPETRAVGAQIVRFLYGRAGIPTAMPEPGDDEVERPGE